MATVTDAAKPSRGAVNKIFGDPVPDIASGERNISSPDDEADHDRWLRENIPPHHD
jgi:hypothetical protein